MVQALTLQAINPSRWTTLTVLEVPRRSTSSSRNMATRGLAMRTSE
jgi:hypothetical protein